MGQAYLEAVTITTKWIYWVGYLLGGGVPPVHSRVHWASDDGLTWLTELTADPASLTGGLVIGKGDGYTIQISPTKGIRGVPVGGDSRKIEHFARAYASVALGDLTSTSAARDWAPEPQGYGGPMYDLCTSNTYAAWLLGKIGSSVPPAPRGAVGWAHQPMFPKPRRR